MRFVILSPRQKYGGAIALHALCKYLNDLGEDAEIFYYFGVNVYKKDLLHKVYYWVRWCIKSIYDFMMQLLSKIDKRDLPRYREYRYIPVKGVKRKILPFVDNKTIVVYPDTIYGNPLKGKRVVRWLLYYNRYGTDEKAYGKNDLFIAYAKDFNDEYLNPQKQIVTTPYMDLEFYKQTNFDGRSGSCYILRKGKNRDDLPKNFDGVIIDDLAEEKKVEVFNSVEKCISYDTKTAYSSLAALCGCKSIIVPEPGKTAKDYRNEDERLYGVAIGFTEDESKYADETLEDLRRYYSGLNEMALNDTKRLIELCKEHFES